MLQSRLTSEAMALLLAHLVLSPRVILVAIDKLDPAVFNSIYELPHRLIWSISADYFKKFSKPIPPSILLIEVNAALELAPDYAMQRQQIYELLEFIFQTDDSSLHADTVITLYLQTLLDERVVKPIYAAASMQGVDEAFTAISSAYNTTRTTTAAAVRLFDTDDPELDKDTIPRTASGCAVFDLMTDGGYRPGHLMGCLAGTGGGKTSLAIGVAAGIAQQKKHAYIFQYEQEVRTAIRYRVWSYLTGIPTQYLASTKFSELTADVKAKIKEFAYIDDYLHVMDMLTDPSGTGGMREVQNVLMSCSAQNQAPTFVAIDWFGAMVDRYMASHNITQAEKYGTMSEALTLLRYNVANPMQCQVLLNHQLNAEGGNKSVSSKASVYDAADFKKFAVLMDGCLIISAQSHEGRVRIFNPKLRGKRAECVAKLEGDVCRFRIENGHFISVRNLEGNEQLVAADGRIGGFQ